MRGKRKKVVSVMLLFALVLATVQVSPRESKAADTVITSPIAYTVGEKISGKLTENNKIFFYKFVLPSSGKLQIKGTAKLGWMYLYLYDEDEKEIWDAHPSKDSATEQIGYNNSVFLTSGTYYFAVKWDGSSTDAGDYEYTLSLTSSNETFQEVNGGSNNSFAAATVLKPDTTTYKAQLALNDKIDYWKFELPSSGKIDLKALFYDMGWVYWTLYDENEKELDDGHPSKDSASNQISVKESIYLTKGTYYLEIRADGSDYGAYEFSLPFTSSNESFEETNGGTNNKMETASAAVLGKTYQGHLGLNDAVDYYRFSIPSSGSAVIKLTSPVAWIYVTMYDAAGEEVSSNHPSRDSAQGQIFLNELVKVQSGTYYVAIKKDSEKTTGNYELNVSMLTQANCPHKQYDKTTYDATYFARGYVLHKCRACGYTYKSDYTALKKLSTVTLGFCRGAKKSLAIQWWTVSDATGYQIRYSKNKSMKKGVKTVTVKGRTKYKKTIKKLKRKKKYYVQVRAYKKSGSNTVYGKWSKRKGMKTK